MVQESTSGSWLHIRVLVAWLVLLLLSRKAYQMTKLPRLSSCKVGSISLKTLLFPVIHVEPAVHDTVARDAGRDVVLHVFLQFRRQIAQAQVAFLIVPDDDVGARAFLGVLADPRGDLIVSRTRGHKQPERTVVDLGEFQPPLIERTVGVVLALPANEDGAAFVDCTGSKHIACQRFARATRKLFAVPQIAGQQFY